MSPVRLAAIVKQLEADVIILQSLVDQIAARVVLLEDD